MKPPRRIGLAAAIALTLAGHVPLRAAQTERGFDVLHYAVRLTPDLGTGSISGSATVTVMVTGRSTALLFDAGELEVNHVTADGQAAAFVKEGKSLRITLPRAVRDRVKKRLISIDYQGTPRTGLQFHPERGEMYTIFSTSQWMPCVDAPDERATLELSLRLPINVKAVATGQELPPTEGGAVRRWRLDTPVPSYTYGFAAGHYSEERQTVGGMSLRYLSTDRTPAELRRIFTDTGDMLKFFEDRAGLRFADSYTQVLVNRTVGQEMAGLSAMSEAYGLQVRDNPSDVTLMAHEAAHQWWGNLLTSRSWNHFWLNEGFATFMAAAYIEHRQGADAYARQVQAWARRLEKLRADGKDRLLVFPDWSSPTSDDRAVVYQKGAYVLHQLRQLLGDDAFWRGVKSYTKAYAGKSVETADFKSSMERTTGRNLTAFFREWVY